MSFTGYNFARCDSLSWKTEGQNTKTQYSNLGAKEKYIALLFQ